MFEEFFEKTRRLTIWDFFEPEFRYRDPETKRFISREEALRRIQAGEKVERIILYRAIEDYPSYGVKKGRLVRKDIVAEIKEEIRFENVIRGVMRSQFITDRDYATQLVEDLFERYERGEIGWREVHEGLSP